MYQLEGFKNIKSFRLIDFNKSTSLISCLDVQEAHSLYVYIRFCVFVPEDFFFSHSYTISTVPKMNNLHTVV